MTSRKRVLVVGFWFLLIFVFALPVLAVTIAVDGDPSDWSGISAEATDLNEPGVPDGNDLSGFYITHDAINLFFRLETQTAVDYSGSQSVYICMDTDNNSATGGAFSQCDGNESTSMSGVDYLIFGSPFFGPFSYQLRQCGAGATQWFQCTQVSGAVVENAWSSQTTEISLRFADLSFDPSTCTTSSPCPIPLASYFDNGDTAPDDNVPDSGQVVSEVNCDGICAPSAISLGAFATDRSDPVVPFSVVTALLFTIVGTGIAVYRRLRIR